MALVQAFSLKTHLLLCRLPLSELLVDDPLFSVSLSIFSCFPCRSAFSLGCFGSSTGLVLLAVQLASLSEGELEVLEEHLASQFSDRERTDEFAVQHVCKLILPLWNDESKGSWTVTLCLVNITRPVLQSMVQDSDCDRITSFFVLLLAFFEFFIIEDTICSTYLTVSFCCVWSSVC